MKKKIVIALGGNAIQSGDGTAAAQQKALAKSAEQLIEIIKEGHEVTITHGNGPQVGNLLLQQVKSDSNETPAMPLDTVGAMSQGMIGYWLINELDMKLKERGIDKDIATIVTRVEVNPDDPAFEHPEKPIGPFYTEAEVKKLEAESDAVFKEDAGRGYRKVVPSPRPLNILESNIINTLIEAGNIVICTGGGGVPVYKKDDQIIGVEGVIDKDFASEKLAELIDADILLILTEVENAYIHFNQPNQQALKKVTVNEMNTYIEEGQFAKGSMYPKVKAAVQFVESKPGRKAIISSIDKAKAALEGKAGTEII